MTSLFDDSDDELSDFGMSSECGDADDDVTTFTVATVLANRKEQSNRRDTITRIMPTITIHDSDKYAIPTTVQKARMDHNHQQEERRAQLRTSESLLGDSPTNSENGDDIRYRRNRHKESIFRAPSLDGRIDNELQNNSTTMLRKIAPASQIEAAHGVGLDYSREQADQSNNRRNSSVMSMSTYATHRSVPDIHRSKSQDKPIPTTRGANVKAIVTSALKIVADGLAPLVVESWDVDEPRNLSGKKHGIDDEKENHDNRLQNRRKSFNIRAEMTLLQDLVQEKTDECAKLRQVSALYALFHEMFMVKCRLFLIHMPSYCAILQELEETQALVQNVQNENAIVLQSKAILESRLEVARDAESVANARVESLSTQLQELQSVLVVERTNKEASDRVVKEHEIELNQLRDENINLMKEVKSREILQSDIDKMRSELQAIRKSENERIKKSKLVEAELQEANEALAAANAAVAKSEASMTSLQLAMEELKQKNLDILAQTRKQNETPAKEFMEWDEASEGIEIEMNRATPRSSNIDNINSLGAEDSNGSLSDHVTKIPLLAVLQRTPDSSSRHLSYADSTPSVSAANDDQPHLEMRQSACSLCFRPPKPNGIIKSCQCGKDDCYKWAHATCLLYRKSVSTCISHPGTPAPPLPTILCDGIWCNRNLQNSTPCDENCSE